MSRYRLVLATVIVGCTHRAAVRTYTAGDTMIPTIALGTRVTLDALATPPRRGAVIVFHVSERPDREYVKRVVGIAGDTISISGTEVQLDGVPVPRCRIGAFRSVDANGRTRDGELWLEALDGASWIVLHSVPEQPMPSGPWKVAPGEVFVLGDSRENSHDSRFWADGRGAGLPVGNIAGTVPHLDIPVLPHGAEALAPDLARCRAALKR